MQSGVVPQDFKQALVNPLIKKQTLCKNYLRNYRPISNLSFLSKILEKVVVNRLHEHIYNHHLSNDQIGPVLSSLYTTSLSQVIANRNLSHHLYADDTQVYISLSQSNVQESLSTLSDCLIDILSWMESSKLKLNPYKTYLIIIGTKQQRNKVINHFPVKLLGSDTFPSDTVRNLGVIFDSDFNFRQHISQVCKSCFYHIRDLLRIRRHVSISAAKTISTALISSRLDYCNSLLNNIAKRDLAKLQRVKKLSGTCGSQGASVFTVATTT